ncbi:MAG: hypothetical protein AB7T07_15235 [Steroidobacteraceae bacterium]
MINVDASDSVSTFWQKLNALVATPPALDTKAPDILDPNVDYTITPIRQSFTTTEFNVTVRSPVGAGGHDRVTLTCTTSIDVSRLKALRLEIQEGIWCVVSGTPFNETRIAVVSEQVGQQLIRDLLSASSLPVLPNALSHRQKQFVDAIEKLVPTILTLSAALVAITGSFWLVTH